MVNGITTHSKRQSQLQKRKYETITQRIKEQKIDIT